MPEQKVKRKLVAIFYADVAGYSRLTGRDELGTHERVMEILDHASESTCYQGAGREPEARAQAEALMKARPGIRCADILGLVPLRDENVVAQYKAFLASAGLPE